MVAALHIFADLRTNWDRNTFSISARTDEMESFRNFSSSHKFHNISFTTRVVIRRYVDDLIDTCYEYIFWKPTRSSIFMESIGQRSAGQDSSALLFIKRENKHLWIKKKSAHAPLLLALIKLIKMDCFTMNATPLYCLKRNNLRFPQNLLIMSTIWSMKRWQ